MAPSLHRLLKSMRKLIRPVRALLFCVLRQIQKRMRPIEHFIVALFFIGPYILVRTRRLPSLELGGVTFVGSQFPDLIDKPLALQLQLLPTGRVFMHSLPFAIPVWFLVLAYGWKTNRLRGGIVFVIAHASHLLADNYVPLASGRVPSEAICSGHCCRR